MTLIRSNSLPASPTKNDNEVKETKDVKQPKQIQKVLDSIGVDPVKPVKQKNEEQKLSKSENIQNIVEKSIEKLEKSGKPLSDIKVDELVKIKEGLKKIEVGSGVDKSQPIPKSASQVKTTIQREAEKINEVFKSSSEIMEFITGSTNKKDAFYGFSKKEFSTENIEFLDSVKEFIKNPSMDDLSKLYNSKIKDLNINAKDMKELPEHLSKGNITESIQILNNITSTVVFNTTDTFFRFSKTPEYDSIKINDAKSNILDKFNVTNNDKFDIKVFIKSPEKFKELEKFAVKDQSYEDIKFLGSINKFANKPDLSVADLSQLYLNYLSPKGSSYINLTSKEQKLVSEFKTCLENQDLEGALNKLPNIVSKSLSNAMEPFSRFIVSSECKEIIQKDISMSINESLTENPTKDKFTQTKLETKKEFIDFSDKLLCKENLDFLSDIKSLLPKPTMDDLKAFQKKYDIDKKVPIINLSDESSKPFNEAIKNNNYTKAFDSLNKMINDVKVNITDTYRKFKKSDEFKALLHKEILKPIEKLPVRSQLKALDEAIKDNPSIASILNVKKAELLEKYLPKISLDENNNLSEFVSGFKKATDHFKTNLFGGEIKNVYKALDKMEESLSISPDKKEQLESIDNAIKQVDAFITKRGKESSKIEWVEALGGRLQEAKQILSEKYSQTQEGKLNQIGNSTSNIIQSVKAQKLTNFEQIAEQLQLKAKDFIKKDPYSETSWAVSTLYSNNFKAQNDDEFIGSKNEIIEKLNSEFPKFNTKQKEILAEKILEGYRDSLPAKLDKLPEELSDKIIGPKDDITSCISLNGEKYIKKDSLGYGNYGVVFRYESESGKSVAVKFFKSYKGFSSEIESHKLATGKPENENSYVTTFKGAIIAENRNPPSYLAIQEFADGGDLKNVISKIKLIEDSKKYSYSDIANVKRYISENIVKGMVHVSENRDMMHLDIKPDNILFDKTSGTFKISDFGTARKDSPQTIYEGTAGYMAPEIFGDYDKQVDKWSIGLTLQELMGDKKELRDLDREKRGEYKVFSGLEATNRFAKSGKDLREVNGKAESTELGKMINSLVQVDPTKRAKFSDLLKSQYFQDPIGTDERAVEILREILG